MTVEIIREYFSKVEEVHKTGVATEHSYRASLEWLFDKIESGVTAINEPKGVKVGRPDFVFQRGIDQITVGHCEAKDINLDVSPKAMDKGNKAQFDRYVKGLPNLIYTNCLDFHFYKNGELVREIKIADYLMGLQVDESQFEPLWNQLKDFAAERLQSITSAERLAEVMAGKAAIIKDVLFNSLDEDKELHTELAGQFKAFKDQLIHDLEIEGFSDIYAETIAYGLFAARLHDEDLETFSRVEALEKLPKSNPFLRKLFEFVAGPGLDEAIKRTIDELAEIFQAVDLGKLFENFGSFTQRNDPFIHFYETFLAKYNPAKRKARGVWYTPEPVVNFIVRAVDDVLKEEFGLADGLADTSKIDVTYEEPHPDKPGKWRKKTESMHRVQILDPAAGTGTFLAEVIKQISGKIKAVAPGQLPAYIENDLIPRLHGFELLMASYAMCHMKLDMMLTSLGYKPTQEPPRLGVYLTNSLEEGAREVPDLLMTRWLSEEARLANDVKRDKPIMCVIGNPPYSGESANKGEWIMNLMEAYKKEPGGKEKLKEQNPKWINNDYMKFIRLSQHMIQKNGEGILGFITSNSFLDSSTFRGMRWNLLKTFNKIYILDLHGNSKRQETAADGTSDDNVFDITEGVSIIIAILTSKNEDDELGKLYHSDLIGSRKFKYNSLVKNSIDKNSLWTSVKFQYPQFTFSDANFELQTNFNLGFSVDQLLNIGVMGFQTHRDHFAILDSNLDVRKRCSDLIDKTLSDQEILDKYQIKNNRDWQIDKARSHIQNDAEWENKISTCSYRPLDNKSCYLSTVTMDYPRNELIQHGLNKKNIFIGVGRQGNAVGPIQWCLITASSFAMDANIFRRGGVRTSPLYLYPDEQDLDQSIRVNMDVKIRAQIETAAIGQPLSPLAGEMSSKATEGGKATGDKIAAKKSRAKPRPSALSSISPTRGENGNLDIQPSKDADGRPNEVAIFDYIYGVLHCPQYRETYKEFLKIDFPRIPYPPSPEVFWDVSEKGTQLRQLHLMEDDVIGETPYLFEGEGDSKVDKPAYEGTSVFINETQSFRHVPKVAWEFFIGGYQPAQKWLKDRKGRELSFDDIRHYQKIIKILSETDRVMKTIEMPLD